MFNREKDNIIPKPSDPKLSCFWHNEVLILQILLECPFRMLAQAIAGVVAATKPQTLPEELRGCSAGGAV